MVLCRTPRLLLAASVLFFGAAYFTVRFPDTPGAGVGSFVSTLVIALPSFVALWRYLGPERAAVSLVALSALGFVVELTGVVTGFPYGSFYYGDSLGPKVSGLVPYLLPLSWAPLVLGAVAATAPRRSQGQEKEPETGGRAGERAGDTKQPARNPDSRLPTPDSLKEQSVAQRLFSAAVLLTLIDGVLDPGAAALGFWVWLEGGIYYGVPVTNYLGWLLSSSLAAALLIFLARDRWEEAPPPPGMLDSAIVAVSFWSGVAVFSGLIFPAALGAGLYVLLLVRRGRLAAVAGGESGYKGGGDGGKRRLVS